MKFKSFADPPKKKKKKYVKDGYEFLCSSRDERPRAENETIFLWGLLLLTHLHLLCGWQPLGGFFFHTQTLTAEILLSWQLLLTAFKWPSDTLHFPRPSQAT